MGGNGCYTICWLLVVFLNLSTCEPIPKGMRTGVHDQNACSSPDCLAKEISDKLDQSQMPCDDLYKFACTGNPKQVNDTGSSSFNIARDNVELAIKDFIEKKVVDTDSDTLKILKKIYSSCVDESGRNSAGIEMADNVWEQYGGFPVLQNNSLCNSTSLGTLIAVQKLHYGIDAFLHFVIIPQNLVRPSELEQRYVIAMEAYAEPIDPKYIPYFKHFKSAGIDETQANAEFDKAINISFPTQHGRRIKEIAEAPATSITDRAFLEGLKKGSVTDLILKYPNLKIEELFQTVFDKTNLTSVPQLQEIYYEPVSLGYADNLVGNSGSCQNNKTVLINYIKMQALSEIARYTSPDMVKDLDLLDQVQGSTKCIHLLSDLTNVALLHEYAKLNLDNETFTEFASIAQRIKKAFKERLVGLQWMDDNSKIQAKKKADEMLLIVGFPGWFNDTALVNTYYSGLEREIGPGFCKNVMRLKVWKFLKQLDLPTQNQDRLSMSEAHVSIEANAYYLLHTNVMIYSVGLMEFPFYHKSLPMWSKIGAAGMVIGHEMTHGFSLHGKDFRYDGAKIPWLSAASQQNFTVKSKCIEDMYSNFTLDDYLSSMKLVGSIDHTEKMRMEIMYLWAYSGTKTFEENSADNGGLKTAYMAYQDYVANDLGGIAEAGLHGLEGFTNNQLFFISAAQVWCNNEDYYVQLEDVLYGHSFPPYRANGPASNFESFAITFHCPAGSNMKRDNICPLW